MLPFCHITLKAKIPIKGYPETPTTIGEHIKKRRLDLGLLQTQAALQLGITSVTLCNWEKNKRAPDISSIPHIITFLGYYPFKRPKTLAERLVAARRHLGLTQRQTAKLLTVDPATYCHWELGRTPTRQYKERLDRFIRDMPDVGDV